MLPLCLRYLMHLGYRHATITNMVLSPLSYQHVTVSIALQSPLCYTYCPTTVMLRLPLCWREMYKKGLANCRYLLCLHHHFYLHYHFFTLMGISDAAHNVSQHDDNVFAADNLCLRQFSSQQQYLLWKDMSDR